MATRRKPDVFSLAFRAIANHVIIIFHRLLLFPVRLPYNNQTHVCVAAVYQPDSMPRAHLTLYQSVYTGKRESWDRCRGWGRFACSDHLVTLYQVYSTCINLLVHIAIHRLLTTMGKSVTKMTGFLSFLSAVDVIRWQK